MLIPIPANGYNVYLQSYSRSNKSSRWPRRNAAKYGQPIIRGVPTKEPIRSDNESVANWRLC